MGVRVRCLGVLRTLAAVVVLGALASGCPSASASQQKTGFEQVFAAVAHLKGTQRTAKLVQLARQQGGKLMIYSNMAPDAAPAVMSAFKAAYGIDVSMYRADGQSVLQRAITESKAGYHGADFFEDGGLELLDANYEHLLVPYKSPSLRRLVRGSFHDGWIASRSNKFVVSWNSKLVSRAQRPRSWEDLASPRWKGKLLMELDDYDWYMALWNYWVNQKHKTKAQADRLFEAMARNAVVVKGHTLITQLTSSGEGYVAASNFLVSVKDAINHGAPLAWTPPVTPLISRPTGGGLVNGAPHPAAAVLFADWIIGAGQDVLIKYGYIPTRRDLWKITIPNAKQISVNLKQLFAQQATWRDRYHRLVSLGKTGR